MDPSMDPPTPRNSSRDTRTEARDWLARVIDEAEEADAAEQLDNPSPRMLEPPPPAPPPAEPPASPPPADDKAGGRRATRFGPRALGMMLPAMMRPPPGNMPPPLPATPPEKRVSLTEQTRVVL